MEKFYYEGSRSLFVEIQPVSDVKKDGKRIEERDFIYTGVILFCQPKFAYIIAHDACLTESTNPIRVEVTFPDKTKVVVAIMNIKQFQHHFIVIGCVPENCFDTAVVKAVDFDEKKLAKKASVHTLCLMDFDAPVDLTSGVVGRTEDGFFLSWLSSRKPYKIWKSCIQR